MLSLSDFFENPTVAEQAALVRHRLLRTSAVTVSTRLGNIRSPARNQARRRRSRRLEAPQPIPSCAERSLPYPLSSGQQRIWFFEELAPDVPLYNESEAVRLVGELHADAMEQALNADRRAA